MSDANTHTPDVGSSEAGQEGRDRQPHSKSAPSDVHKQSKDAGNKPAAREVVPAQKVSA